MEDFRVVLKNSARTYFDVRGTRPGLLRLIDTCLAQLDGPHGVVADQLGTVYVADYCNHRIMRWPTGATQGSVIAGGNGAGEGSNQLDSPRGLLFNRHGNLYVVDEYNHRVQKINTE